MMTIALWIMAAAVGVFIPSVVAYYLGYNAGVDDTEGRWSEAVARGDAKRESMLP